MTALLALSLAAFAAPAVPAAPAAVPAPVAAGPDRSGPPPVAPPTLLALPDAVEHKLSDKAVVYHLRVPGVRDVTVQVSLNHGALWLDGRPSPLATATQEMLDVATKGHSAEALEIEKDLYELSVSSSGDYRHTVVDLRVPVYNLDKGLGLLTEVLTTPAYPKDDLKLYVRDTLRYFEVDAAMDSVPTSQAALRYGWYPSGHLFAAPPDLAGIKKVNTKDLAARHQRLIAESPTVTWVVGDVSWEEIAPKLEPILAPIGKPGAPEPFVEVPAFSGQKIVAVHFPGAEQARVTVRTNAPKAQDADRLVTELVHHALGGTFLSRLNRNLREEKGFTYGVRSNYYYAPNEAYWQAAVEVAAINTGAAIIEIQKELATMADKGLTPAELESARVGQAAGWNETLATGGQATAVYTSLYLDQTSASAERANLERMGAVGVDDTVRVAKQWFSADAPRLWVIVGDREKLEPQLQQMGWKVEWVSAPEVVLGRFVPVR